MNTRSPQLAELVRVTEGFKPSVQLPDDFYNDENNQRLIRTYIPTSETINLFVEIAGSLRANDTVRVRSFVGTFGTGKSDLLLMICNYFARDIDDPIMEPFYTKIKDQNESQYEIIRSSRANRSPYLVVLLQPDAATMFPGFVIYGLEQALEKVKLSHLMLQTRYSAACQQIEAWQQSSSALLEQFTDRLRVYEHLELAKLLADLRSVGADLAFKAFERTYLEVIRSQFNVFEYGQPHTIYASVARALTQHGYSGILLVCDEFTEFLRRFEDASDQRSREVDSEMRAVQNLAETAERSGPNPIHFIVASLEGFASAAAGTNSGQASQTIERLGGRFFHSYPVQNQRSEELIRGAIQRTALGQQTTLLPQRQRDDLETIARKVYPTQRREWVRDTIINGAFPLHPLTTYALPLINRQVAQSQRTMFQFLKADDGLQGFLESEPQASEYSDWNNLLTLDRLYSYFEESIAARYSEIIHAVDRGLAQLSSVKVDKVLAERALKALALCEVIAPSLPPTFELLRGALNMPPTAADELKQALGLLDEREIIQAPDTEQENYLLPLTGRTNRHALRRRISTRAQQLPTTAALLQSRHPATSLNASNYNQRIGTHRELQAFFVNPAELHSTTRLKNDLKEYDALLWYVVAGGDSERADAQSKARQLSADHKRLVVAVPLAPVKVLEALRNYVALESVRNDSDLDEAAKSLLSDSGQLGRTYRDALHRALSELREPRTWEWYRGGVNQSGITSSSIAEELASKVMIEVFPNTPAHAIKQHFKASGSIGKALQEAADLILKNDIRLSRSSASPAASVLRQGAAPLGLIKKEREVGSYDVFGLCEPAGDKLAGKKVWKLLYDHLGDGRPWSKLIEHLKQPPYGMYDSLLFIFSAAFLSYHADLVDISAVGTPGRSLALDATLLEKLITKPADYIVKLQPLNDRERQWLHGIVTAVLQRQGEQVGGRGATLSTRVAEQMRSWLKRQQLPLLAERLTAEQLTEFAPDADEATRQAALLLITRAVDNADLAGALLIDIPATLNAAQDHESWTAEEVELLHSKLSDVRRLIEDLPMRLEEYVTRRIATIFGCAEVEPENRWNHIYSWRALRNVVSPDKLSSPSRTLFRLTYESKHTIKSAFLEEFAKNTIGINTDYAHWPSLESLNRLEQEIRKAFDEITNRWSELAPKEEVWYSGLSNAALGRNAADKSPERAARYLAKWAASVRWPSCAPNLRVDDIARLYPELLPEQCADVANILRRTAATEDEWRSDLTQTLASQFDIGDWSLPNVNKAVERFSVALRRTGEVDDRLRRYTLGQLSMLFNGAPDAPIEQAVVAWRVAHPIPIQNDLSEDARTLLAQIADGSVIESALLTGLPRALDVIGQSYQQWGNIAYLDRYRALVEQLVSEIDTYIPLSETEYAWLSGIVTMSMGRALTSSAREKRRLAGDVLRSVLAWRNTLGLPHFSDHLTTAELAELYPETTSMQRELLHRLLGITTESNPVDFLLHQIPETAGAQHPPDAWATEELTHAHAELGVAMRRLENLSTALRSSLYRQIGSTFGVDINGGGSGALTTGLRRWRDSHVLMNNEPISPAASALYNAIGNSADDADTLLLRTLPAKISETRAPYDQWSGWSEREPYLAALANAVTEIEERGRVQDATPRAQEVWAHLQRQLAELTPDEQRWLIRQFREVFPA